MGLLALSAFSGWITDLYFGRNMRINVGLSKQASMEAVKLLRFLDILSL